jgi:multicomponent Na+:H+ antiporter subunit B
VLAGCAGLLVLALAGLHGLAPVGHVTSRVGRLSAHLSLGERHVTNAVSGVTFDLRGLDTLGEEFILFAASTGAAVLLRRLRDEREERRAAERDEDRGATTSGALRMLGAALVGPVIVLGGYLVTHGPLTPGGGFQGGVILAGALVLVYVAGQAVAVGERTVDVLDAVEAAGAAGFALVGLGGLIFGSALLENFLPLGTPGHQLSGGTIPLANLAVGIEVAGALVAIVSEFLDQMLLRRRG